MRRDLIVSTLIGLLMLPAVAGAGSITFDFGSPVTLTTSGAQDARLDAIYARLNAQQPAGQQWATVEAWLHVELLTMIRARIRQAEAYEIEDACVAYNAASAAVQNSIKTALGNKSPCVP